MNAIVRALTELGVTLTAVAALLDQTDPATLNLDAIMWNWITIGLAVAVLTLQGAARAFERSRSA